MYSTHAAASSGVAPAPSTLTTTCGSAPIVRQNAMNSSLPKSLGSRSFHHALLIQDGRRSRGPTPHCQW